MAAGTHPPETDLLLPLPPEGELWDPATVHTHYFGIAVPEAKIGTFIYLRYLPYYPLCQGGFVAYEGMNNLSHTDASYHDYVMTMPWPEIDGNQITTPLGIKLDFIEPGKRVRLQYASKDGSTSFDIEGTAISPLAARGHVIPGEELHKTQDPGGTEQFMHYTGELVLHGERHEVDCRFARDHSWRQVRSEARETGLHPPVSWTPIYFGDDFAFNQVGMEAADTDPAWKGIYDVDPDAPSHYFGWVSVRGEIRDVVKVRRNVTKYHPLLFSPLAMEIDAEDEAGDTYHFEGEAVAQCPWMVTPNAASFDSVYLWRDDKGREAYGTMQTMQTERFITAMKRNRPQV
jgi:hypothetical protein